MRQPTIANVIAAEQAIAAAHLTLALDTIAHYLHDDYVIVQPGGQIETKQAVLESYQHENRHWDSAKIDELEVRLYNSNHTAVVIGRWQATGQNNNLHFDYTARFLSVWVWQDDRWQNVAYQATEIPSS